MYAQAVFNVGMGDTVAPPYWPASESGLLRVHFRTKRTVTPSPRMMVYRVGTGIDVACSIDTTNETMALHRGAEPCVCPCINKACVGDG